MPDPFTPLYVMDTLRLLAAGLVRQHESCSRGAILDARNEYGHTLTPQLLLRAQARISRLQLASGEIAAADSLHHLVSDCTKALKDWAPLRLFEQVPNLAELVLIDPQFRIPTSDCFELARDGHNLDNFRENEWHDRLRQSLGTLSSPQRRAAAYTTLRRFLVEHPVATDAELKNLTDALDDVTVTPVLGPLIREMYQPLKHLAETARRCGHCNSLIEEGQQARCSSEICRTKQPVLAFGEPIPMTELWSLRRELIFYWVIPGRAEIELFDALKLLREDVTLYPNEDEADIGIGGNHEIGIDLKDRTSMPRLAASFQKSRGGLAAYKRGIVVVTDRGTPVHGEARRDQLREAFEEFGVQLEVMTVADVLKQFGWGKQA